jgi:hypothetical protein
MGITGKSNPNIISRNLGWLIPLLIIVILFATNPSESKFKEFLTEKAKKENKTDDPVKGWIDELLSGTSARIEGLTTNRKEYYLFSTYEVGLVGDKKLYVGLLNHFVILVRSRSK